MKGKEEEKQMKDRGQEMKEREDKKGNKKERREQLLIGEKLR